MPIPVLGITDTEDNFKTSIAGSSWAVTARVVLCWHVLGVLHVLFFFFYFLFKYYHFYFYYVALVSTTVQISHNDTDVLCLLRLPPLPASHPSVPSQSTRLSSLCYTLASHQLSITHPAVYIYIHAAFSVSSPLPSPTIKKNYIGELICREGMETQIYRMDILILFLLAQLFNTVIHEWENWAAPPSNQTSSLALILLIDHTMSLWKACHCSWFKNERIDSYGIPVICIRSYCCLKAELSFQDRVMLLVEVVEVARAMAAPKPHPNHAFCKFHV